MKIWYLLDFFGSGSIPGSGSGPSTPKKSPLIHIRFGSASKCYGSKTLLLFFIVGGGFRLKY